MARGWRSPFPPRLPSSLPYLAGINRIKHFLFYYSNVCYLKIEFGKKMPIFLFISKFSSHFFKTYFLIVTDKKLGTLNPTLTKLRESICLGRTCLVQYRVLSISKSASASREQPTRRRKVRNTIRQPSSLSGL